MAYVLSMDVLISVVGMFRWLRLILRFFVCLFIECNMPSLASDWINEREKIALVLQ